MARYIINFVIHSLIHLLNDDLKLPILCCLKHFVAHLLPDFAGIVNSILHILVPVLVTEASTADSETGNVNFL